VLEGQTALDVAVWEKDTLSKDDLIGQGKFVRAANPRNRALNLLARAKLQLVNAKTPDEFVFMP
jgi:hypothetical protein